MLKVSVKQVSCQQIAIGTLGAFGIANSIKESGLTDTFVVNRNSCDDYEPVDYCTPLFP